METQSPGIIKTFSGANFLLGKPAVVRKGEFQFISVKSLMGRSKDSPHRGQIQFADPGKGINYLFLLELELQFIRYVLPFATSASSEMEAKRCCTLFREMVKGHDAGFHVPLSFLRNLEVNDIAGCDQLHKNYHVIHLGNSIAFGAKIGDLYFFKKWVWFTGQYLRFYFAGKITQKSAKKCGWMKFICPELP
jgi:hypothetical protein